MENEPLIVKRRNIEQEAQVRYANFHSQRAFIEGAKLVYDLLKPKRNGENQKSSTNGKTR